MAYPQRRLSIKINKHIGRLQQTFKMFCPGKTVVVGSSPTWVERPDSSVGRARKRKNRPAYISVSQEI